MGISLERYILETKPCPAEFLSDDVEKKNPAYEEWILMDSLLLGRLFNTMIVEITSQMISYKTS